MLQREIVREEKEKAKTWRRRIWLEKVLAGKGVGLAGRSGVRRQTQAAKKKVVGDARRRRGQRGLRAIFQPTHHQPDSPT